MKIIGNLLSFSLGAAAAGIQYGLWNHNTALTLINAILFTVLSIMRLQFANECGE